MKTLLDFAKESNEIERIYEDERHLIHQSALEKFLKLTKIQISDLSEFVRTIEPSAFLRTCDNHSVWIGGKEAVAGSKVPQLLDNLLNKVNEGLISSFEAHAEYEMIHPFIDGNGRSGRALWLWMERYMRLQLPFLQYYYYQTLQFYKKLKEENVI